MRRTKRKKSSLGPFLVVVILLAALLGGTGHSEKSNSTKQDTKPAVTRSYSELSQSESPEPTQELVALTTNAPTPTPIPTPEPTPISTPTPTPTPEPELDYVLNTNTKKFHYPDCSSVDFIKPENRLDYTGTRSSVIAQGFDSCGKCKP